MSAAGIIGWDIGGAHVKAALLGYDGRVHSTLQLPCALWKGLDRLHAALEQVLGQTGHAADFHAVTMSGEMADSFPDRAAGVQAIVDALSGRLGAERVMIFAGAEGYLGPRQARRAAHFVASANWLATATWLSAALPGGLLVDVGSTTTDLVPFAGGAVTARGNNDRDRLVYEELVYSGVARTPVMALVRRVPVGGEWVGVMAEQFATSADLYRILGTLPAHADQHPPADGGARTRAASERRLARMLGMDVEQGDPGTWYEVARYIGECQLRMLADACARVLSRTQPGPDAPFVGAGTGRFLAQALAQRFGRQYVDFNSFFETDNDADGFAPADCAPAVAVAALMLKKMTGDPARRSGSMA